jgi:hypothetical protein
MFETASFWSLKCPFSIWALKFWNFEFKTLSFNFKIDLFKIKLKTSGKN